MFPTAGLLEMLLEGLWLAMKAGIWSVRNDQTKSDSCSYCATNGRLKQTMLHLAVTVPPGRLSATTATFHLCQRFCDYVSFLSQSQPDAGLRQGQIFSTHNFCISL